MSKLRAVLTAGHCRGSGTEHGVGRREGHRLRVSMLAWPRGVHAHGERPCWGGGCTWRGPLEPGPKTGPLAPTSALSSSFWLTFGIWEPHFGDTMGECAF